MTTHASAHPVFISYARAASRARAVALYEALGGASGGLCFLDSTDIESGEPFPSTLVDALLGARVIVIFPEPVYFTRDFCRLELEVASTPFVRKAASGAPQAEREEALSGIVLALPAGSADMMLDRVPPSLRELSWPSAQDTHELAALVRRRLDRTRLTFQDRYEALGELEPLRAMLLEACRLLPPLAIGTIPFVAPPTMRQSLRSRFIGRGDDLWRVHQALTTQRGDLNVAAGMTCSVEAAGGFGKTQLAAEYVHRHATRTFHGGIFWIDAEWDAEAQLYQVLRTLEPDAPAIELLRPPHGEGVGAAVARVIRRIAEPVLFVIDNVPEPEAGNPPAPPRTWCPVLGEVSVLTTSRRRLHLDAGSAVRLEIRELQPEQAVMLLRWQLPSDALSHSEWEQIASWVGYLPLGLELLNALLALGGMQPRSLLARSREGEPVAGLDHAMEVLRPVLPPSALRGISEVLFISYDRLGLREKKAARLVAWMAPAAVPEALAERLGPEVFAPEVRVSLRGRHLITGSEQADGGREYLGSMHGVIADFMRTRSQSPGAEIKQVSGALVGVLRSAEGTGNPGRDLVQACAPAVLAHTTHRLLRKREKAQQRGGIEFAITAGEMIRVAGFPQLADEIFQAGLEVSTRALGPSHEYTLGLELNLANSRRDRGDFEGAQALYERVVRVARRVLGKNDPNTLLAMSNLAACLQDRGDAAKARVLQEQVQQARGQALDPDDPVLFGNMLNMAVAMADRGDFDGALALEQEVVEKSHRALGPDDSTTLSAMNNLADTLSRMGNFERARELHAQVLESRRRMLGEEHPDTLRSRGNLAHNLGDLGDFAAARALHEEVIEAQSRILGPEHPGTLGSIQNLANVLGRQRDWKGARRLHSQVFEAYQRLYGEDNPHTIGSIINVANTFRGQGDLAAALRLDEKASDASRRVMGTQHPLTHRAMANLASTRVLLGDVSGARALQQEVVGGMRATLGREHPATLAAMDDLATTLGAQRDFAGARALQEEVLEATRRALGQDHPVTLTRMCNLAATLSRQDDAGAARALAEQVLQSAMRLYGKEHPETTRAAVLVIRIRIRAVTWPVRKGFAAALAPLALLRKAIGR